MSPFSGRSAVADGERRVHVGALSFLLLTAAPAEAQLTIHLSTVPADTPAGAEIYVAGSFNGWDPAAPEFRLVQRDGRYVLTLPDWVRGPIEFKFTRGSWDLVELDGTGGGVPNRRYTVPAEGAAAYTGSVAEWRNPARVPSPASTASRSVSVLDTAFAMPELGRERRVWLYLPPDYATSTRRYPVLYMHDGQNVFDAATSYAGEWGVDETLDSLHAAGDPGVIVVAVDNGRQRRLDEYSPWRNARLGGGEGDAYVDFLANTLKPYIDRSFRTLAGPGSTAVAGSSMGGLISLYAALRYPHVFGGAGVFSPAFWFAPEVFDFARQAAPRGSALRIYMVTGAQEGERPEIYARDHQRMVETLAQAGLHEGDRLQAHLRQDGTHSEWFWRREFPAAYRWLFGRE